MAIPESIGVTFAPTAENAALGRRRGASQGVQEAIQILSMRLPQVLGARAPAPRALLEAPGAAGGGGAEAIASAVVRSVLQSVLGGEAPAPSPGGGLTSLLGATPSAPVTRAVGPAPIAPDRTANAVSSAARVLSALPRVIPGFREGFGETGFLGQQLGESAFTALQRKTTPETRQAQIAGPIAQSLAFQEQVAQNAPEFLPRFRKPTSLAGIEELAKLTPGFLRPISEPAPQRTLQDVLSEAAAALAEVLSEERRAVPSVGLGKFTAF